jgi:hypothetical protein
MKYIFISLIALILFTSCDKVAHPYPPSLDLDTTIYPGNWVDYESSEWPTFTVNANTNRNILLEDFTGHKCIFCPAAASLAETIEENNSGRVYVASIHVSPNGFGSFQELQEPYYTHNFTNTEGLAVGKYFGEVPGSNFVGNPWGAISRVPVNGQNTLGPSNWTNQTNALISANSLKVNIQSKLNYYEQSKGFYLHTEIENLGTTNDLAQVVYLLENSIIKPQSFPGGIDSMTYLHHNVMRGCIDGQPFGRILKEIDKKENGKYYLNYSYKIPAQYNPSNMHLLIFVIDKVTNEIYQVIKQEIN